MRSPVMLPWIAVTTFFLCTPTLGMQSTQDKADELAERPKKRRKVASQQEAFEQIPSPIPVLPDSLKTLVIQYTLYGREYRIFNK